MSLLSHLAYDILTILGPTATGKTQLAVQLADNLGGEIISADSRQVYRGMDIGTGKDLGEYNSNGNSIPYHLIDIVNPTDEYNVAKFQKDFQRVSTDIRERGNLPILCGGTGFYIKAVLMDFQIPKAEPNKHLRERLESWSLNDLVSKLESISPGASENTPTDTKRRVIRAIEIELGNADCGLRIADSRSPIPDPRSPILDLRNCLVLGIDYPRKVIRERITARLHDRLEKGMIEEVELLLKNGVTHAKMDSFGLEYRYINQYLLGELSRDVMVEKLNTAIHRFAKKQMTFFRNMEKNGIKIHWIPEGDFEIALGVISKG
ncbi:MAG: tRNA (adenosine(37)-N6)-dimethylallyltransferase MiaA [Candidatus Marinimicrobia bacterium]|nr:tRNA (adenosine(37)-N6)-dimethylallyltransferase MiaA [Candidatus Neomarinimicrobiota bacterium]